MSLDPIECAKTTSKHRTWIWEETSDISLLVNAPVIKVVIFSDFAKIYIIYLVLREWF